jgi:hypothetical protein
MLANDAKTRDPHECISGSEDAFKKLGLEQYATNLIKNVDLLPELLFYQCKDWAKNTTGHLYLTPRKIESSYESVNQIDITQENYDLLPFIITFLSQSKIALGDGDLYQFLKIAQNQTDAIVTIRVKDGQENLKYLLTLSTTL